MDTDLIAWIAERAKDPIEFGKSDCVPLCAAWVIERSGIDPLAAMRPLPYHDRESRDEYAARNGGMIKTILRGIKGIEMLRAVAPSYAPVGAVGLGHHLGQCTMAIKHSAAFWATRGPVGVVLLQSECMQRAWTW